MIMSITKVTRLAIRCDGCEDPYIHYYGSPEEAVQGLVDAWWDSYGPWTFTDAEQICGQCTQLRICAKEGHTLQRFAGVSPAQDYCTRCPGVFPAAREDETP
jgi:hypothetical protein